MKKQMRRNLKQVVTMLFLGGLVSCGSDGGGSTTSHPPAPTPPVVENPVDRLWADTVESYLSDNLWEPEFNYDASHLLMLPLYYAFQMDGSNEQKEHFHQFFARYSAHIEQKDENLQRRLLFYFLTVNYLSWCECSAPSGLLENITLDTINIWNKQTNTTWGAGPFDSYKESISWKVAGGPGGTVSFGKALFDAEILLLAVGARLKVLNGEERVIELEEMTDKAVEMFEVLGVQNAERWIFQPGVWAEYRDYRFAGHHSLENNLAPSIIPNIGTDSSHIARMPLWLDAVIAATDKESLKQIKRGFTKQFEEVALIPSSDVFLAPRLTNYIDGSNGLYRYGFNSLGEFNAYQPYELSGALVTNWYGFMGSEILKAEFSNALDNFPLSPDIIEIYSGPSSTTIHHPLVQFPAYFENGFAELYMRISVQF